MKWFPLTDPLVRWPEGAHPILGEAATGHSANEGDDALARIISSESTVCRLLGGGASLGILHEAPLPKERNTESEEHAQPLSLVT